MAPNSSSRIEFKASQKALLTLIGSQLLNMKVAAYERCDGHEERHVV